MARERDTEGNICLNEKVNFNVECDWMVKKKRKSHEFKVKESYSEIEYYKSREEFEEKLKPFIREIIENQRRINQLEKMNKIGG